MQIQSPASTSSKLWWIAKPTGKQVRNFPLEYFRTLTGYSQQGFLSQWCMECQIVRCSFLYINADFLKRVLSKNSQAFTGFNHRDITVEPPCKRKRWISEREILPKKEWIKWPKNFRKIWSFFLKLLGVKPLIQIHPVSKLRCIEILYMPGRWVSGCFRHKRSMESLPDNQVREVFSQRFFNALADVLRCFQSSRWEKMDARWGEFR